MSAIVGERVQREEVRDGDELLRRESLTERLSPIARLRCHASPSPSPPSIRFHVGYGGFSSDAKTVAVSIRVLNIRRISLFFVLMAGSASDVEISGRNQFVDYAILTSRRSARTKTARAHIPLTQTFPDLFIYITRTVYKACGS